MSKPEPRIDVDSLEGELLALVAGRILDVGPDFHARSSLAEAGLDSMAVMQLLVAIEDRFGLWLPESDLVPANLESVGALARLLAERLRGAGGD